MYLFVNLPVYIFASLFNYSTHLLFNLSTHFFFLFHLSVYLPVFIFNEYIFFFFFLSSPSPTYFTFPFMNLPGFFFNILTPDIFFPISSSSSSLSFTAHLYPSSHTPAFTCSRFSIPYLTHLSVFFFSCLSCSLILTQHFYPTVQLTM